MAGIKDKITGAMEDGSLLTLGLVALVAVAGEVNQRRGGGSASFFGSSNDNGEDDLWWQEGGFYDEATRPSRRCRWPRVSGGIGEWSHPDPGSGCGSHRGWIRA
jgi:hypothetical protein